MKALNEIDVRSVYNEERGGFGPLRAPKTYPKRLPSVETNENNEILFIDKIKHATRSKVRSNTGCAFERTPTCVRRSCARSTAKASQRRVCSNVGVCVRTYYVRLQTLRLTTDNRSRCKVKAMEHRAG
jgi:hypothetical protein